MTHREVIPLDVALNLLHDIVARVALEDCGMRGRAETLTETRVAKQIETCGGKRIGIVSQQDLAAVTHVQTFRAQSS